MKITIVLLLFSASLYSQNISSLSNLINIALHNNPEIKAHASMILAQKESIKPYHYWEQPQFNFEYWFNDNHTYMWSIAQQIPFPTKISLNVKKAKKGLLIAQEELFLIKISIISEIKKIYYNYFLAYKKVQIHQEHIQLLNQIRDYVNSLYRTGQIPKSDLLKIEIEISQMENDKIIEQNEYLSLREELKAIVNLPLTNSIGIPEMELNELPNVFITNRTTSDYPAIIIKNNETIQKKYNLKLAQWNYVPDFMLGIKFDSMGQTGIMASLSLPLYFFKISSDIKMKKHEYNSSLQQLNDVKNKLKAQVVSIINQYDALRKSFYNYKNSILPLSEQTLELTQTGFKAKKNSFLDLLDSQQRYLDYRINYYETWIKAKSLMTDLETITGSTIE